MTKLRVMTAHGLKALDADRLGQLSGCSEVLSPQRISDRQFAQGLADAAVISEEEAEEWVGPGTVPPALMKLINQLPESDRFPAKMLLRGASSFERSHPLIQTLATAFGWSAEQTAQYWRAWSLL